MTVYIVLRDGPLPVKAVHSTQASADVDAARRGPMYYVEEWTVQWAGEPDTALKPHSA